MRTKILILGFKGFSFVGMIPLWPLFTFLYHIQLSLFNMLMINKLCSVAVFHVSFTFALFFNIFFLLSMASFNFSFCFTCFRDFLFAFISLKPRSLWPAELTCHSVCFFSFHFNAELMTPLQAEPRICVWLEILTFNISVIKYVSQF